MGSQGSHGYGNIRLQEVDSGSHDYKETKRGISGPWIDRAAAQARNTEGLNKGNNQL